MKATHQQVNDAATGQAKTSRATGQKRALVDMRPAMVAQRKLVEMMDNSPRVMQQRAQRDAIHNSPHMVAQRHKMNALFGGAVEQIPIQRLSDGNIHTLATEISASTPGRSAHEHVLNRIFTTLGERGISYKVGGSAAAKLLGARRAPNDLELEMPDMDSVERGHGAVNDVATDLRIPNQAGSFPTESANVPCAVVLVLDGFMVSASLLPSALPKASVAICGPDVNGRNLEAKTQARCGLAGRSAQVQFC
jgi:hypothetical protein